MFELLIFTISFAACAAVFAFRRKHFLLAMMLLLMLAYEVPGAVIFAFSELSDVGLAQHLFSTYASESTVSQLLSAFLVLLTTLLGSYVLPTKIRRPSGPSTEHRTGPSDYWIVGIAVLVFGMVSVITEAGAIRLADYEGADLRAAPVFSYGTSLLVVFGPLAIWAVERRKWPLLVLLTIATAPLSYEAFAAAKRQYFAPLAAVLMLYVLYSARFKRKLLILSIGSIALLAIFSAQFLLRADTGIEETTDTGALLFLPQLGEFVAIGSTSLFSITLVDSTNMTYGMNLLLTLLNSVPYIKFGDLFFPEDIKRFADFQRELAPYGGLSAMAEAWWSLQWGGVLLLGMLLGRLLRYGHACLWHSMAHGMSLGPTRVYGVCLVATLFVKYRSGVSDALQAAIYLSILYWALMLPALFSSISRSFKPAQTVPRGAQPS
jgi:hypothetical protein